MKISFFRWLSLLSYFGLILTLLAWIILAPHTAHFPKSAILILAVVPLLLPMRGLLYARPYTHAWASFLILAYFTHGIGELYSDGLRSIYPWLEVILSCLCFIGCIFYIKVEAKMRGSSQNKA